MDLFNVPLKMMTLGIELGILCFFWRLSCTRMLLLVTFVFHTGIFLTTGICFWLWMLIHGFLLAYVWKPTIIDVPRLFNFPSLVFSICIIATGNFWSSPVKLAWLDVPFTYASRIEAETEQGTVYILSPDFFGPYDYNFTFQNYSYVDEKLIQIRTGGPGTSAATLRFFQQDLTDEEILEFENRFGVNRFSNAKKDELVAFFRTFFRNRDRAGSYSHSYLSYLKPPDLLWQSQGVSEIDQADRITKVSIYCVTKYYSSITGIRTVRNEHLLDVALSKLE